MRSYNGYNKKENHPQWKGGRKISNGYVFILQLDGRYIGEHRLVMEEQLDRKLLPEETVHHKNGIRSDNKIENLELWSSFHPKGQRIEDLVAWAKDILFLYGMNE